MYDVARAYHSDQAHHLQIQAAACAGKEQAVSAWTVLYDAHVFSFLEDIALREESDFVFPMQAKSKENKGVS